MVRRVQKVEANLLPILRSTVLVLSQAVSQASPSHVVAKTSNNLLEYCKPSMSLLSGISSTQSPWAASLMRITRKPSEPSDTPKLSICFMSTSFFSVFLGVSSWPYAVFIVTNECQDSRAWCLLLDIEESDLDVGDDECARQLLELLNLLRKTRKKWNTEESEQTLLQVAAKRNLPLPSRPLRISFSTYVP
mgnify:CR=1 FL=1